MRLTLDPQRVRLTLELSPPKGVDVSTLQRHAVAVAPFVDAINVPDCQRALLKMSSLAAAVVVQQAANVPTVWQLTCRDRNLLALQADLLGGWALGLSTVLALTGDPVAVGDHNGLARQVSQLEAVRLMQLIAKLNGGHDAADQALKHQAPSFTVVSALNPHNLDKTAQFRRLCHKLEAGAMLFQSQPVFHVNQGEAMVATFAKALEVVGFTNRPKPKLLVGLLPPRSAKMALLLNTTVPGIQVPLEWIQALEASDKPTDTALDLSVSLAQALLPVADGYHLMPVALESRAAEWAKAVQACLPQRLTLATP
jgi:methylenetetrahydrofolate reductase (NADPH)